LQVWRRREERVLVKMKEQMEEIVEDTRREGFWG